MELEEIRAGVPSCEDGVCRVNPDLSSIDIDGIVNSILAKLRAL